MDRRDASEALHALTVGSDEALLSVLDLSQFRRSWNLTEDEAATLFVDQDLIVLETPEVTVGMTRARWEALKQSIISLIKQHQAENPDSPGARAEDLLRAFRQPNSKIAARQALRDLCQSCAILRFGQLFHLPGHEIRLRQEEELIWEQTQQILMSSSFDQPRLTMLAEKLELQPDELRPLLNKLSRIGWLERVSRAYFMMPETLATLAAEAERAAACHPQKLLTVGNFREMTGISRHMVMPLLEYFDRAGFTRRIKTGRVLRRKWTDTGGEL